MITILFPSNPLNAKQVDSCFQDEYDACQQLLIPTIIFDLDNFINNNVLSIQSTNKKSEIIYRGWMLTSDQYQKFYDQLLTFNYQLINSPKQYLNAHHLPNWYNLLQTVTPKSVFSKGVPSNEELIQMFKIFDDHAIMIKDYVKSRKYEWAESFYIPDASNLEQALAVSNNFIKQQNDDLTGGIVLRSFEPLQSTTKTKNNKPITQFKEVRIFMYYKQPVAYIDYWNNGTTFNSKKLNHLIQQCHSIDSNFFSIDCGEKTDGSWIIIEIGDAQVSDLQGYNSLKFYQLITRISW